MHLHIRTHALLLLFVSLLATGCLSGFDTDSTPFNTGACSANETLCEGVCVSLGTVDHCARCNDTCSPTGSNVRAACTQNACTYTCEPGTQPTTGDDPKLGCAAETCTPTTDPTELCDGVDNNCDGTTDEDNPDLLTLCTLPQNTQPIACANGLCIVACLDGFTDTNSDLNTPNSDGCETQNQTQCTPTNNGVEICDGVDNDCNDTTDDIHPNTPAADTGCSPPPGAVFEQCTDGTCIFRCADNRADVNEDLNTPNSDGCECTSAPCPLQEGVCSGAQGLQCPNDDNPRCPDIVYTRHAQNQQTTFSPHYDVLCDSVDNDCDGNADEDCVPFNDAIVELAQQPDPFYSLSITAPAPTSIASAAVSSPDPSIELMGGEPTVLVEQPTQTITPIQVPLDHSLSHFLHLSPTPNNALRLAARHNGEDLSIYSLDFDGNQLQASHIELDVNLRFSPPVVLSSPFNNTTYLAYLYVFVGFAEHPIIRLDSFTSNAERTSIDIRQARKARFPHIALHPTTQDLAITWLENDPQNNTLLSWAILHPDGTVTTPPQPIFIGPLPETAAPSIAPFSNDQFLIAYAHDSAIQAIPIQINGDQLSDPITLASNDNSESIYQHPKLSHNPQSGTWLLFSEGDLDSGPANLHLHALPPNLSLLDSTATLIQPNSHRPIVHRSSANLHATADLVHVLWSTRRTGPNATLVRATFNTQLQPVRLDPNH